MTSGFTTSNLWGYFGFAIVLFVAKKQTQMGDNAPRRGSPYVPPADHHEYPFSALLSRIGRAPRGGDQIKLPGLAADRGVTVFYAGELDLLDAPTVSIVGTREVSDAGWQRASLSLHGIWSRPEPSWSAASPRASTPLR